MSGDKKLPEFITKLLGYGFYLFPTKGKRPKVKWSIESTNDPEKIAAWLKRWPNCDWGVDLRKSGVSVIDNDAGKKPAAIDTMFNLEMQYGLLPRTLKVKTPHDGEHYYFVGELANTQGDVCGNPGVDTRGPGGLVIAPGSKGYKIIVDAPIAPLPGWAPRHFGSAAKGAPPDKTPVVTLDTPAAIQNAIDYLAVAEPAFQGEGGDTRTYKTANRVKDLGISREKCFELMLDWNDRCLPPWDLEDLQKKVNNAYGYGRNAPGKDSPQAVFTAVADAELTNPSRFKLYSRDAIMSLPPIEWIVKGILPTRGLFQVYGPSIVGKSFFIMDMLFAIVEGLPWAGRKTRQREVVYICLEGESGLRQRLEAWEKHNERRVPSGFHSVIQPWNITKDQDIVDLAAIVPQGAVIVVDTQNRAAPAIDESSSKDMGLIIEGAKKLERLTKGCVGLIAHTGKDVSKGARGHSSQLPAMDAVIELTRDGDLRTWKAHKVKDGKDGQTGFFLLPEVALGEDEDGDPITSCIVDFEGAKAARDEEASLGKNELAAWKALLSVSTETPDGLSSNSCLKQEFAVQLGAERTRNTDKAMSAALSKLQNKGWIAKVGNAWKVARITTVENDD